LKANHEKYEKLISPSVSMIEQINMFKEQIEKSKEVLLDKGNSLEFLLMDLQRMDED